MPNVPVVRREPVAEGALLPATARGIDAQSIGLEQFAVAARRVENSLQYAGTALERQKRAEAQAAASRSLAEARLYWLEEGQRRKEAAPLGAPDYAATFLKDFRADAEKRLEAIEDDDTKDLVRERLANLEVTIAGDAHGFEYESRIAHRKEHLAAGRDAARKSLFLQPSMFADVVAEREAILERSDVPATVKAALRREEMGELALSAAQGLLEKDPEGFLAATSGKHGLSGILGHLDADRLAALTNSAQAEIKRRAAEARAAAEVGRGKVIRRTAIAKGDAIFTGEGTLAEKLAAARALPDPEIADAAAAHVLERHREAAAIEAERVQRAQSSAWQAVEQGAAVDDVPNEVLAKLPPGEVGRLQDRARQVKAGVEPVTDWGLYHRFVTMPPAELARTDLATHRDRLDDGAFSELTRRQAAARDGQVPEKPEDPGTLNQQIETASDELGLLDPAAKGRFQRVVRQAIDAEQAQAGRSLNFDERQRVVDRMTLTVTTRKGYVTNTRQRVYEIDDGGGTLEERDIADQAPAIGRATGIPAASVPELAKALRDTGQPVTLETLQGLWALAQRRRGGAAREAPGP